MSVAITHPGVYLVETPSGNRTLTGVATSITAFVGRTARGPVNEPVQVDNWSDFERGFGGLWRGSGLGYAVRDYFGNGGGTALIVRITRDADTAGFALARAGGGDPGDPPGTPLALEAVGPGAWANPMSITVSYPGTEASEVALAQGVEADDLFTLEIRADASSAAPDETFVNVTVADGPRRVDLVLLGSRFVRATGALGDVRPDEGTYAVGTEGSDGDAPEAEDYVGGAGDSYAADKLGLYALEKTDLFNLLCLPPPTPDADLPDELWADALSYCVDRRAFLVVDAPAASTVTTVKTWAAGAGLTGPATRNAGLYFPRLRRPDPLRGGVTGDFASAGAVCGVMARTDATRGVWKAPAGTDASLTGATGLTVPLTDGENGQLNPLGLNCLRNFPVIGPVIWGSRTLRGADVLADEYKYVPVRRLTLFLEESLFRGTQWVVFEPNDHPLWSQIRASLGAFMQDLFRQGAFQGTTPRDAYFVRCDEETTTQYDIDRGIVNIQVGFAPLKPAEFVVISLQQKTAESNG